MEVFKLMKIIKPSMKAVTNVEFKEYLSRLSLGQNYKFLFSSSLDKEANLMYFEPPSNNLLNIGTPNKELLLKILKYLNDISLIKFKNKHIELPYFRYPWYKDIKINLTQSKL